MPQNRILIVDDDSSLRIAISRVLGQNGYNVSCAKDQGEALQLLQNDSVFHLVILDYRLPQLNGLQLMEKIRAIRPNIPIMFLTGFATVDLAVKATQKGAISFLTKPFNMEDLLEEVASTLVESSQNERPPFAKVEAQNKPKHDQLHESSIIGRSAPIVSVLDLIDRVADSDSNILITGESGTGKELIAKALHRKSSRARRTFVPINCGAIPSELLESELFGHVKGAFTGAANNRTGRFEMAHKGTLFLDEIGDMSPHLQVKLLRVLQERQFEPVGSTKTIHVDVRVIAATHRDLEKEVEKGHFREDLYYRLNVIPIHIPPLRERTSDIPLLIHHFIQKFNKMKKRKITSISQEAMQTLLAYPWPGNIRELENLVERVAIIKGQGEISLQDLPPRYLKKKIGSLNPSEIDIPEGGLDFNSAVDSYENELIQKALQKTGWNRNQAALLLKLNRTTLVEKIKKKGIRPPEASA